MKLKASKKLAGVSWSASSYVGPELLAAKVLGTAETVESKRLQIPRKSDEGIAKRKRATMLTTIMSGRDKNCQQRFQREKSVKLKKEDTLLEMPSKPRYIAL